jgi:hypothetical protein
MKNKFVECLRCGKVLKRNNQEIFEHLILYHYDKDLASKMEKWSRITEDAYYYRKKR